MNSSGFRIKKIALLVLQFFKFGIVGISNTLISLGVYYLLVFLGLHYVLANASGFVLSVVNSYFWNSRFVFKEKNETNAAKSFFKVFVSYGISFALSTILLALLIDVLYISPFLAPILRLVFTIPLNFFMNKLWAFKEKLK